MTAVPKVAGAEPCTCACSRKTPQELAVDQCTCGCECHDRAARPETAGAPAEVSAARR